jgi:hypothetical protein
MSKDLTTHGCIVPLELLAKSGAVRNILVQLAKDLSHLVKETLLLLDLELVCLWGRKCMRRLRCKHEDARPCR